MNNPVCGASKRILVVDDEALVRDVMKKYRLHGGYEVLCAADGFEALQVFTNERCDLVITDRMMQNMTGDMLASEIRKMAPHIPIILATGTAGADLPENLFNAVLCKPVAVHEVLDCLKRLLG